MQLLEKLRAAVSIAGEGVSMWVDPPRVAGLTVTLDRGWAERKRAQREEFKRKYPEHAERQKQEAEDYRKRGLVREMPKLHSYHLHLRHARTGTEWDARLAIDADRRRIDWTYTSTELLSRGHTGSAGIGVWLITLPIVLLLLPYVFVRARLYAGQEEREGISRNASALLKALGDQITEVERLELRDVFRNEWAHDRLMGQTLSFERAKGFLKGLSLTEERATVEEAARFGDSEADASLHWFDENGDCLAQGSFYGARDHYVQVLGSTFEDKEADVLATCYAKRRLVIRGTKEDEDVEVVEVQQ